MDYQNNNQNLNNGQKKKNENRTMIITIIIILLVCVGIYGIMRAYHNYQTKELVNNTIQSASKIHAYSIISSFEDAYSNEIKKLSVSNDANKEFITIDDIRNSYSSNISTWNEDNTITSKIYNFICNVTVNSDNKIAVSCDINGEIIESDLLSLKINNSNNESNNTQDNPQDNNTNNTQNNNTGNNTTQNNNQNNQTNNNATNVILYKIVKEQVDGTSMYNNKLYVNDKLVPFMNDASSVDVEQLGDILIVERSLGSAVLYAVDKNANVIGVFSTSDNDYYKEINILPTKLYYRDTYRIEGNNLYIETDKLGNGGPGYILCHNITDDNEVVVYEEKFEYLGNNKFSSPIVTKTVTRKQYLQEHNITCN